MLLQVLRLTQDQIGQLPPAERDAILTLVSSRCKIFDSCLLICPDSDRNLVTLHDDLIVVICLLGGGPKSPVKHFLGCTFASVLRPGFSSC
jgi:Transcription termination and cleavage factor C-terminal